MRQLLAEAAGSGYSHPSLMALEAKAASLPSSDQAEEAEEAEEEADEMPDLPAFAAAPEESNWNKVRRRYSVSLQSGDMSGFVQEIELDVAEEEDRNARA